MHRIDGPGAAPGNQFTAGNPSTGVQATVVTPEWCNAVQEEIANTITGFGGTLNKLQNNQLFTALQGAISAIVASSGGEANTGANVGTGAGQVFKQKGGVQLQFRTLKAGNNITITQGVDDITITSTATATGTITGGANNGAGTPIYSGTAGANLFFNTLKAGANVSLSAANGEITISATAPAPTWGNIGGSIANQADLQAALNGKSNVGHTHAIADISNLQTTLNGKFNTSGGAIGGDVTVTGSVSATGGFNAGSSAKLKVIDGHMPYGLEAIEAIEVTSGKYREDFVADGRRRLFVIAEQLERVVPEAVINGAFEYNGERVAGVDYQQLVPVLIQAVKELTARVRDLEAAQGA